MKTARPEPRTESKNALKSDGKADLKADIKGEAKADTKQDARSAPALATRRQQSIPRTTGAPRTSSGTTNCCASRMKPRALKDEMARLRMRPRGCPGETARLKDQVALRDATVPGKIDSSKTDNNKIESARTEIGTTGHQQDRGEEGRRQDRGAVTAVRSAANGVRGFRHRRSSHRRAAQQRDPQIRAGEKGRGSAS